MTLTSLSPQYTLRAMELLQQAGIWINIMNTLSKYNASDLIPLMRKVGEEGSYVSGHLFYQWNRAENREKPVKKEVFLC